VMGNQRPKNEKKHFQSELRTSETVERISNEGRNVVCKDKQRSFLLNCEDLQCTIKNKNILKSATLHD